MLRMVMMIIKNLNKWEINAKAFVTTTNEMNENLCYAPDCVEGKKKGDTNEN